MSPPSPRTGFLAVVSGPSGSGKTTLCRKAVETDGCFHSISCTTRAPRTGEVDGVDYHFLSRDEFLARTVRGDFLEWARVHGNFYGTLRSDVLDHIEAGRDVVMDIDVQGAQLVRSCEDPFIRAAVIDIFILPPSMAELESRLSGRGTESEDQLRLRLYNALDEMRHWREYRYTIVSGSPDEDLERFLCLLRAARLRTAGLRTPEGLLGGEAATAAADEPTPPRREPELFS